MKILFLLMRQLNHMTNNRFSHYNGKCARQFSKSCPGSCRIHTRTSRIWNGPDRTANGVFSIPVEGGGTITVVYVKTGFITGHRNVYVPWNDIAIAETVTMISEDTASTTLAFDGNPSTIITHNSSTVTDAFGSRSLTMVFSGDNQAFSIDEFGN